MIDDDATPEELERWYRRTPDEIEAERQRKWNADWSALRTPDHLAYEPDTMAAGGGEDTLLGSDGPDHVGGESKGLDAYQRALLDTIARHEGPQGYDVLYSPTSTPRRIKRGADGQPDYRRHPNDPAPIMDGPNKRLIQSGPNKGKPLMSSAAGRYQFIKPTWEGLQKAHPDLTDFSPANQDKGAWYLASDTYKKATGRNLAADLRDPKLYPGISKALRPQWTSLPGGIEQGQNQSEFERRMNEGVRKYQPAP